LSSIYLTIEVGLSWCVRAWSEVLEMLGLWARNSPVTTGSDAGVRHNSGTRIDNLQYRSRTSRSPGFRAPAQRS